MDKLSLFILNVFLNSLLAFLTTALLIELLVFLFRIKQGRIAALLRTIPILKLPLDLTFYNFSKWSYLQGVNPLNCDEGTRTLSIFFGCTSSPFDSIFHPFHSAIQFVAPGDLTFTLADVLGHMIHPNYVKLFAFSLVTLSICNLLRTLTIHHRSVKILNRMALNITPLSQKIQNPHLIYRLRKGRYRVFSSSVFQGSPFVRGLFSPAIYFPDGLFERLSQKEFEAILAHEMEHVRNKDLFIRFVLEMIAAIYWWVPTKWLRNTIEDGHEVGCDYQCKRYNVDSTDLASAICKTARHTQHGIRYAFAPHLTEGKTLRRIKILLQPTSKKVYKLLILPTCFALGIAFFIILLGKFWIF